MSYRHPDFRPPCPHVRPWAVWAGLLLWVVLLAGVTWLAVTLWHALGR